MTSYPLQITLVKVDYNTPNKGEVSRHTVNGRKGTESEEYDFYVIDPMNGNERGVYGSKVQGGKDNQDVFYYVEDYTKIN